MYHYKERKKKKLAEIKREGEHFSLSVIRYDQKTGEKKDPVIFRLEEEDLKKRKASFEDQAADLGEVLKDMKLLEEAEKKNSP